MKEQEYETAIFAGGCFWCTEAVFQRLKGVKEVASGYTGGTIKNPAYREICTGRTGHAEAVKITFDPNSISFETLLEVFFVTHDPTTLNQQGADRGTQYRSEIFYMNEMQKITAQNYMALLAAENIFKDPIVTALSKAPVFYTAEEGHQNYYNDNQSQGYCRVVIDPKVKKLEKYYTDKLS